MCIGFLWLSWVLNAGLSKRQVRIASDFSKRPGSLLFKIFQIFLAFLQHSTKWAIVSGYFELEWCIILSTKPNCSNFLLVLCYTSIGLCISVLNKRCSKLENHTNSVNIFWLKFIYSEKATKFCAKSPLIICLMYCQSNNWCRFCKIVWPSQNIWTLCVSLIQNKLFVNLESYKVGFLFVSLGAFKQKVKTPTLLIILRIVTSLECN